MRRVAGDYHLSGLTIEPNAGRKQTNINSSPVTEMVSMTTSSSSYAPFSTVFNSSRPNSSATFLVPSFKFSTGISNFANLSNGFSLKSPINPGFLFKSRPFTVQARAAAEKTVHDFTVKVWFFFFYPIQTKKLGFSKICLLFTKLGIFKFAMKFIVISIGDVYKKSEL